MPKQFYLIPALLFLVSNTLLGQCFNLNIESREVAPNQALCQDFIMQSDELIGAFQWTVQFDPELLVFDTIIEVNQQLENGSFVFNADDFIAEGKLPVTLLADIVNPLNVQIPELMFTMCFQAKDTLGITSDLKITDDPIAVEIITPNFQVLDLCENPGTITFTSNPTTGSPIYVYADKKDIDCSIGQTGSIDVYSFFGSPPFTYNWTGPNSYSNTSSNIEQLQPGDYTVSITDELGNLETRTYTIFGISTPVIAQPSFTLPECYNDSTGVIDISVDFGTGPYTYHWSNNTFNEDLTNVPPGTYDVTVVDSDGCAVTSSWNLNYTSYGIEFLTTGSPSCYFSTDGYIDLTPNQNAALPLTYEWNTGANTEDLVNIGQGYYEVLITDGNGCQNFFEFDLSLPSPPVANEIVVCSTMGENNGYILIELVPSSTDYTLAWDDDPDDQGIRFDLAPGVYNYNVTDNDGCVVISNSIEIVPAMQNYVGDYFSCELDSIQFSFEVAPGTFTYSWTPEQDFDDANSPNAIYLPPPFDFNTPYQDTVVSQLTLTAESGCISKTNFELRPREFCVWPGDTNDDRAVSALDFLNLGLANGSTGLARWPLSSEWFAQPQRDFGNLIPGTSLDASYADCDGNGIVEAEDTSVVIQNFGLSHYSFTGEKPASRAMDIPLSIVVPESFRANEQNSFDIILGNDVQSVDQAHGIAFQIAYDPSLVDIGMNKVTADGWLSETGEVWTIDLENGTSGLMDVVLTRTDGMGMDGYGKIANLQMQFVDFNDSKDIVLEIKNAYLVDNQGAYSTVEGMTSSSVLIGTSVSTQETTFTNEYIFPNPVKNTLMIQTERDIQNVMIYNSTGVLINMNQTFENKINTNALTSGVYFIHLIGEAGTGIYKFIKI